MRILHTSDWHLGHSLAEAKRYAEFDAFLNWLSELLLREKFDALIVAGDIFDTANPPNKAREQYYNFLARVAKTNLQHIVIVGGNHDSPSFLDAPDKILASLGIKVVAAGRENISDELVVLKNNAGEPIGIICAVPYLRDREIRTSTESETAEEKISKRKNAIKLHYKNVCDAACKTRENLKESFANADIPIVATAHLFVAGEGEDIKYVGNISDISSDVFDKRFTYVAAGHIHSERKINAETSAYYSGSPLFLSFEQKAERVVLDVEVDENGAQVSKIQVPQTSTLKLLSGSENEVINELNKLKISDENVLLEIDSNADNPTSFRKQIEEITAGTKIVICKIKNAKMYDRILRAEVDCKPLESLTSAEVFARRLEGEDLCDKEKAELMNAFEEIIREINEAKPE